MSKKQVPENEIYPKFEFRLGHEEKAWLMRELGELSEKFNGGEPEGSAAVNKNSLIMAALRHGFRHLRGHRRLSGKGSGRARPE